MALFHLGQQPGQPPDQRTFHRPFARSRDPRVRAYKVSPSETGDHHIPSAPFQVPCVSQNASCDRGALFTEAAVEAATVSDYGQVWYH